ncbi:hypothetical protein CATMIT_01623, partial [Catenibacterium mitsuokai DSM 15897]
RAGLEDVDARMAVGQPDQFPHVDAELVADDRQLVGEGDVDVAEGVLGELAHLGGARVGDDALAAHEAAVQLGGALRAARGHAADDAVVLDQFAHHLARQHALGAVGDVDVGGFADLLREAQVSARIGQPLRELLGGADRRGRLQHHQIALTQHRRQRLGRGFDIAQVGLVIALERGRHRDQVGVGVFGRGAGAQQAAVDRGAYGDVERGLDDVDLAAVDRVHDRGGHVDADHALARRGERGGGGKADVTQADDRDGVETHKGSSGPAWGRGAQGCVISNA